MSEVVGIVEATQNTEGIRQTKEVGHEVFCPDEITDRFDTEKIVRGRIVEMHDEGNRVTATCKADFHGQVEKFYIHFPVGNLQRVIYAETGDES